MVCVHVYLYICMYVRTHAHIYVCINAQNNDHDISMFRYSGDIVPNSR